MRKLISLALISLAFSASDAGACVIRELSKQQATQNIETVVIATVIEASKPIKDSMGASEIFSYKFRLTKLENGKIISKEFLATYHSLKAHFRRDPSGGEMLVCPIVSGSGIETAMKNGKSYRLWLTEVKLADSVKPSGNFDIVWAEEVED